METSTFIITVVVLAVFVYFNFFSKKNAFYGYTKVGQHTIRKDYKFIKVEFRSEIDGEGSVAPGIYGFIDTKNPFFISNILHLFDQVNTENTERTLVRKSTMRLDSPDFEKWLKAFDESVLQLELVRGN